MTLVDERRREPTSEEESPGQSRPVRREPRPPRKVSPRYLENAALHHLQRYAATVAQLKRVLLRRVNRSVRAHGTDKAEALAWVDALLAKLVRNGLLDDVAYADARAHSLRASGRSARAISQKLRLKGVAPPLAAQKVAQVTAELTELEAAWIWARKKRLGPYRATPDERAARRQRDLASLARAGFSFSIAKQVVEGNRDDAPAR